MTRDDLKRFCALDIDFEAIGLMEPGVPQEPYFCDPVEREEVGRLGCDGIHFILLPGDERVFCVDPSMGEIGTYVLPVGSDFREFLSFVLYCKDASPLSQIFWMGEERFNQCLNEDETARWPGCEEFFARKQAALDTIASAFQLKAVSPYPKVKALQAAFDPSILNFSDEYYDILGIERS